MNQSFVDQLPAILVGGPPHSGKSVLIYSLTKSLRAIGIEQHYTLRACPDGEGDWSNEAPQPLVTEIRIKGEWTDRWVQRIRRDINNRQLPLLVDVGGRPTPEQMAMFSDCTHAILLTPDAESREWWSAAVNESGLTLLADLHSDLHGENRLDRAEPVVTGVLAGLERSNRAQGPAYDALVQRLAALLSANQTELKEYYLAEAPKEIDCVVDLDRLAVTLGYAKPNAKVHWEPEQLPPLLDYLPQATPLAVYGRGTNWVQAALARYAAPAVYASFDPRLGWVQARSLSQQEIPAESPLQVKKDETDVRTHLEFFIPETYLDYDELATLVVPPVSAGKGLILSGKLPLWLYTSLAVTYAYTPWLAVYQPNANGAILVASQDATRPVGSVMMMGRI